MLFFDFLLADGVFTPHCVWYSIIYILGHFAALRKFFVADFSKISGLTDSFKRSASKSVREG